MMRFTNLEPHYKEGIAYSFPLDGLALKFYGLEKVNLNDCEFFIYKEEYYGKCT